MNEMTIHSKFKNLETRGPKNKAGCRLHQGSGIAQGRERGGDEKTTQAPCPQHLEAPGYALLL